ncbi:MAG: hypothetical protein AAFV27_07680, partial [Pseudomonadota bacterium]
MGDAVDEDGWGPMKLAPGVDPLSDWTLNEDPLAEGIDGLLPVTVGLVSGDVLGLGDRLTAFAVEVNRNRDVPLPMPVLRVPGIYRSAATDGSAAGRGARSSPQRGNEFFTVLANRAVFDLMAQPSSATSPTHPLNDIFWIVHGSALPPDSLPDPSDVDETTRARVDLGDKAPKGGVVVTAVIDTGIPLLNANLRDASGKTRVQYAWIQDGKRKTSDPSFTLYGREYDADDLNDLIDAYSTNGPYLDEVAAYRKMGLADFRNKNRHALGRQVTHGAHVTGLAAGYPMAEDRVDNPVIAVQLPRRAAADTSGQTLVPHLLMALDYIAERADRLAKKLGSGQLPLVINFSFGGTGGPLDGTSFLEQRMDAFLAARNADHPGSTAIVLPSGNARQSQGHAHYPVANSFQNPDKTEELTWRIQPDDQTISIVEVWTPKGPLAKRLEVAVGLPHGGQQGGFLQEVDGDGYSFKRNGKTIARITYRYYGAPTNRGKFCIVVQATAKPGRTEKLAPAGGWTLTLKNVGLEADDHVDAWVLRDDELPGFDTDARQSRFVAGCYKPYTPHGFPNDQDTPDCRVIRDGLQNVLATGEHPIVIAGYVERIGVPALYSAGGPMNTPSRRGPDALAVSDNSRVHRGV